MDRELACRSTVAGARDSATVTMTQSFAHPQVDLGLQTKDEEQAGLLYFALVPAGIISLGGEPNPTVCTITAV